jgi:hypothetical protein
MHADPRTIDRVEVEPRTPEPAELLAPGEAVETVVDLRSGWVAVTDRRVVAHRADREPRLVTVARANVVGLSLRRAGSGPVVRYAPRVAVYGLLSVALGLVIGRLAPAASVGLPEGSPVGNALGFVDLFTAVLELSGLLAVVAGGLAVVGAVLALGYRLLDDETVLTVERAGADPIRCSAGTGADRRTLERLADALRPETGKE